MDWAVVITNGVYPVICLRESRSWGRSRLLLPPHKVLQLTELCPQVRVGRGYCLGDGGVDISYFWLRSGTKVSIPLESADIIPPELSLLGKRNVASVKIQRHSDRSL